MSSYPDGMTSRHWEHLDGDPDMGDEHHIECPHEDDFQGINNANECYCGNIIGEVDCECDCMCDTLDPRSMSEYDMELERLGL